MPELATPTGERVDVGGLEVVMLADPARTKEIASAIETAMQGAGTTWMVPGNRQRYALVVDTDTGQYGISVAG